MREQELTAPQRAMVDMWERHMAAEFDTKSIDATMATMTAEPVVNHVPVMTGGVGPAHAHGRPRPDRGRDHLPVHPLDPDALDAAWRGADRSSRRGGAGGRRRVRRWQDQRRTHLLDQASVLAQLGMLDVARLPVTGVEAARKTVEPAREPSNALIMRAGESRM